MRRSFALAGLAALSTVLLSACDPASLEWDSLTGQAPPDAATAAAAAAAIPEGPVETLDPDPPPPPPPTARTADQFDTTSAEDRAAAAAVAPEPAGEERLGTTIASLGNPADPGIWIETPLVSALAPGRAEVVATGKSINIELRPSGRPPGSGSEISLPAMRLLDVAFTALEELVLYRLPGE